MKIEFFHASKYGNGLKVAEEFQNQMKAKGHEVNIHNIKDVKPNTIQSADLYVFASPGRIGKPIGSMRRFLKKISLPAKTRYAVISTEMKPKADKKTGRIPSKEETDKWQRIIPIMDELLQTKDLIKVTEMRVMVIDMKGPLEDGWQKEVMSFSSRIVQ